MEGSLLLLFFLRPKKQNGSTVCTIYFRMTVNRVQREMSTQLQVDPALWCNKSQRVKGKSDIAMATNECLNVLYAKAIQARAQLMALNKPLTVEYVSALVNGKPLEQYMLLEIFQMHNKKMKQLIGIDYTEGTLEKYERTCNYAFMFMRETYNLYDIDIQKLDYSFITDFEHWLKTVRKCAHNTTMKYLAYFKKIVLYCIKKRWLTYDPFAEYKMSKRKKRRTPLSQIELDLLSNKTFHSERLTMVKDIFLFSCYTGLAFADAKKLKQTDIYIGMDGHRWITCRRKKTEKNDSTSNIPLLPAADAIVQRYADFPEVQQSGLVLPIRSNQKTNEYLKEIATICGIQINLTFHIARHTFATTVTLANKVPIETVSKMLAHQKLSTTQEYAQVMDTKVSADMSGLRKIYDNR